MQLLPFANCDCDITNRNLAYSRGQFFKHFPFCDCDIWLSHHNFSCLGPNWNRWFASNLWLKYHNRNLVVLGADSLTHRPIPFVINKIWDQSQPTTWCFPIHWKFMPRHLLLPPVQVKPTFDLLYLLHMSLDSSVIHIIGIRMTSTLIRCYVYRVSSTLSFEPSYHATGNF